MRWFEPYLSREQRADVREAAYNAAEVVVDAEFSDGETGFLWIGVPGLGGSPVTLVMAMPRQLIRQGFGRMEDTPLVALSGRGDH